jgi:pimeloyl-ACP methyl ester carboxylesterase
MKDAGYFRGGLPYNRLGSGPDLLVVFQGLQWENKPLSGMSAWFIKRMYRFLGEHYTVYIVMRRPGLPQGFSMGNMSDDYAAMMHEEFEGPVDVLGISTGGSIALHFGADHPDLIRRLVIHSAAHSLGEDAKRSQMNAARYAEQGRWRAAFSEIMSFGVPPSWHAPLTTGFLSTIMAIGAPEDPSDFIITIEAEDEHEFRDRLDEITTPTLIVAGAEDMCYPEEIVRETAEGIPNSRLILYRGMGHVAGGKQFRQDVLKFLREDLDNSS